MIEVLWHGRGGQGAFTAARLLGAATSLEEGSYTLAFPSFGPERRGAPMRAFTKISDAPIGDRSAIQQADYVVYLDDTLLAEGWERELKPGGRVLVNSVHSFDDPRIVSIDANGIATAELGRPIPNTALLGGLAALCPRIDADDLKTAIEGYMPEKLHEANKRVVDVAQRSVLESEVQRRSAQQEGGAEATVESQPKTAAGAPAAQPARRRPQAIPTLRENPELRPEDFARTTCFEAGHLVDKNAGWRNQRPVVDAAACTGCLQCYLHCPDGAVFKPAADESSAEGEALAPGALPTAAVAIDLDFCKGCGICARICRFGALRMVPESEA